MRNRVYLKFLRLTVGACVTLSLSSLAPADGKRGIHTSREGRSLPLAEEEDMFHFVVFGDRTGGPAEGIKVLEKAVEETNLLDPDLVLTVGDLINGYNDTPAWMKQMEEFRGVMDRLGTAWFPVAGNHDVYWRGEGKPPPQEHESNYEKHFGPLWYWFEHKKHGFLVLYTDEHDPEKGPKNFGDPNQMQMSAEQLVWLKRSLGEMSHCEQIFVFLHHPRWMPYYKASNWPTVHRELAAAGNVSAVFAGHIHRLHYGGKKDGIEYFALATTGGSMPGHFPEMGYVHHLNVVTVRKGSFSMGIVPVGSVIDPRIYTWEKQQMIDSLRNLKPVITPVAVGAGGSAETDMEVEIVNPAPHPIEVTVSAPAAGHWFFLPDHHHETIQPREIVRFPFHAYRPVTSVGRFRIPALEVSVDLLTEGTRVPIPPRKTNIPVKLEALPEEFFADSNGDKAVYFKGKNDALRVESELIALDELSPFTLETWVKVDTAVDNQAIIAKTENSEFAFFLYAGKPRFDVHLDGKYQSAESPKALENGRWHHLAGQYNGASLQLFVDGKLVATTEASGKRTRNGLPLYLGADPDRNGNAGRFLAGALADVRLSRLARYVGDFEPAKRHEPDADTLLLLHLDKPSGPFFPSHTSGGGGAVRIGDPKMIDR